MADQPQVTDFSRDVLGRYTCNSFAEAVNSTGGGASPFHYIVVGGGTFGGILSSFLYNLDPPSSVAGDDPPSVRHHSRILVLEAGPYVLPEHEQNLPAIGIGVPGPTSIADLRREGRDREPRNEVWGLAWHSDDAFNGLAYCLGGRSLFWGGWAARFLDSELATWPAKVRQDLAANDGELWADAAHQLGADDPNDFVNGPLHGRLRRIFFESLEHVPGNFGPVANMVPLDELPDYLDQDKLDEDVLDEDGAAVPKKELRLDAPYAVQTTTRSGFFPSNKFSSVPLMTAAARQASRDSGGDDSRKQFMVVPNCHVTRLVTQPVGAGRGDVARIVAIETNQGRLDVAHNAAVFLALGAIESARLAQLSFPGVRGAAQMGRNLMVHLRTNTFFRVRRDATRNGTAIFGDLSWDQLEVSAVQLRGRIAHEDATTGHFHLQVTASGVAAGTGHSEAEFFKKIPDLDQIRIFQETNDDEVAIAIRGIGEFAPLHPASDVTLDPEVDEFGVQRAFVRINDDQDQGVPAIRNLAPKEAAVLEAMTGATNDVLQLFGQERRPVRSEPAEDPGGIDESKHIKADGVGTTYHEAGTLRMGDDPEASVVDPDQRFWGVANAYVADLSVAPTCGSANPLQPGTALARRLARHLATPAVPSGGMFLFEDTPTPFWRLVGAPAEAVTFGFGELEVRSSGAAAGLYWNLIPTPADFELSVDWLSTDPADNSGIFLRFPDPDRPPPGESEARRDPATVAVDYGFEVQIDATAGGSSPTGAPGPVDRRFRATGAIYNEDGQDLGAVSGLAVNQWHTFIVTARDLRVDVQVQVDGGAPVAMTSFHFDPATYLPGDARGNPQRGQPTGQPGPRYVGLQAHPQTRLVRYRNIFIRPI